MRIKNKQQFKKLYNINNSKKIIKMIKEDIKSQRFKYLLKISDNKLDNRYPLNNLDKIEVKFICYNKEGKTYKIRYNDKIDFTAININILVKNNNDFYIIDGVTLLYNKNNYSIELQEVIAENKLFKLI